MSNKTQLSTNNERLTSLIQELQGKAAGSGGASVETCTVTVDYNGATNTHGIAATCYIDGEITTQYIEGDYTTNGIYTIENVVCGSCVTVGHNAGTYVDNLSGALDLITSSYHTVFKVTVGVGETAIVTLQNDK